jgi:hypothetical protein
LQPLGVLQSYFKPEKHVKFLAKTSEEPMRIGNMCPLNNPSGVFEKLENPFF